ncbi:nitric oxide dioxygenase [Melghirimyces profundicolus]|uniref:Flavohemoprotein n=1 Tax=Melghirimyces profundicolus TaxID=1242148 RepID=A0A2T6C7N5_9BACL|nr:NO-inducible flavohemoprotein [Melghirimyces profundicolus]PTX64339.1 nitric oxide dioxygenase [Melghirimyces profundicolus]
MLDEKTLAIVKRTAPVLKEQGEVITRRFYGRMFSRHPELYNIFNRSNQREGKQARALADTVYAAAAHIDRLEDILPVVERVAHKHRALGVRPEQYPIVGENLLWAIGDVLGEAATGEVLDAWKKAYDAIARIFIGVEERLVQEVNSQPGGWAGFRPFQVVRKVRESEVITSFYLKPADGGPLARFQPGQYVTVRVRIPGDPCTSMRHYSLSGAPGAEVYRITVKREDGIDGKPPGAVSTHLHRDIREGDVLELSAPAGDFTLKREGSDPVILLSGGVGLTPLVSMLRTLVEEGSNREITFIHAAVNGRVHALGDEVSGLAARNPRIRSFICYEKPTERDRKEGRFHKEGNIDGTWLRTVLPSNRGDFYLCGPFPFMKAMYRILREWGVDDLRIHYEVFGPTCHLDESREAGTIRGRREPSRI